MEEWHAFGITELRRNHCIKRTDNVYVEPELASGLKWAKCHFRKPPEGRELTSAVLAEALKEKTEFTAEEWQAFGLSGLTPHHYIKSGGSYYKPFDVPEGFLPTFTLTHIPAATTKHKRPKVYPAPEREGS